MTKRNNLAKRLGQYYHVGQDGQNYKQIISCYFARILISNLFVNKCSAHTLTGNPV